MKKFSLIVFVLFHFFANAQENNNLLWEISKKDSNKKSYVYGTMHVNDKISYHLSDAFYEALLAVEVVATESNPEHWEGLSKLMNSKELISNDKFYREFYLKPVSKENVKALFNSNTTFYSGLISSGANESNANYQEDTVLDMFIFQTGKKYNKISAGLEDAKMSLIPSYKLTEEDLKPNEAHKSILQKMLKSNSALEYMQQMYREKNIVMIDSLYRLLSPNKVYTTTIVDRNLIMANSMAKIMETQTLFSGIGAAHLAGKEGVLQLLKNMGYEVKPASKILTEKGETIKKEIEANFPKPELQSFTTIDGILTMPIYKTYKQEDNTIVSPDYKNGGAIKIQRLRSNSFLTKSGLYDEKSIDSLFFENIPGTISSKVKNNGINFVNFEIDNTTKTGHTQHHAFYITPLEIIAISLTGPKNYAKLYASSLFPNIKLKQPSDQWVIYQPKRGGFSVKIPAYHTSYGETLENPENIELQGYLATDSSYYFVTERNLNSFYYLEDSAYEEKQIHKEFFMQFDVEPETIQLSNNTYQSEAFVNDKKIILQTKIYNNKYYLLGTVSASESNNKQFFDSFAIQPFLYKDELAIYTDTLNNYSISLPKERNERIILELDHQKVADKDLNANLNKNFVIKTENGKKITFNYFKFNRYASQINSDSIQNNLKKYYTNFYTVTDDDYYEDDYYYPPSTSILNSEVYNLKGYKKSNWHETLFGKEENPYTIISESNEFDANSETRKLTYIVSKKGSNIAIKNTVLLREDAYITLENTIEKNTEEEDDFIASVVNSVKFIGKPSWSIFDNKIDNYIADATSKNDTLRYTALEATRILKITETDIPKIIKFLNNYQYTVAETSYQNKLLIKLGSLKDDSIIPFLETYYKTDNLKAETQLAILEALSYQKSKKGYDKILNLLEYDLPLSNSAYEIENLFSNFSNDLEHSKELFPKIFQFYTIPEYKESVIKFSNKLIENNYASAKKLKSYQRMIITNAKLEYKRLLSWKLENTEIDEEDGEEIVSEEYIPTSNVIAYLNLLEQFKKNKETTQLIEKLKKLEIQTLDIEIMRLASITNSLTNAEIKALLADEKKAFLLMQLENTTYDFTNDEVARAALSNFYESNKNDKITLHSKREVSHNGKTIAYYFYKITEIEPVDYEEKLISLAFVLEDAKPLLNSYRYFNYYVISDEEEIPKKIETIINQSINRNRFRATYFKLEDINYGSDYDYEDY